jgi:DnaJ-class molecular chaperone
LDAAPPNSQVETYYTFLGVSASASGDEIKRAYRRLALKFHPDLNPGTGSEQVFARAYEAYRCLSDPDARIAYDAHLAELERKAKEPPPPAEPAPPPEPQSPRRKPRRGADRTVVLRVPRRIRKQRVVLDFERWDVCPRCNGDTDTGGRPCAHCLGVGQVLVKRDVTLRIRTRRLIGGTMTLPEEGDVGLFGGPRGDVVVMVLTPEHTVIGSIWPAIVAAMVFYAIIGVLILGWLMSN